MIDLWVLWFVFMANHELYSAPLHPYQSAEACRIAKTDLRAEMEQSYPMDEHMWFLCLKHSEGPPKGSQ